ncbi:uncharacterized protein LOC134468256 [Engraulis encrasicolus]|uniref:uncharacterized protein LOC134468256 n=1 Tax=Engraulis encrasicolus TaxID=184585 RepID=UPI002FD62D91
MGKKKLKAFVIESGKTLNSGLQFVERLSDCAKVVQKVNECDVVLAICPIVSRVGTDIEAAMTVFEDKCAATTKPIFLVVLHHTFDKDYVAPDCSRYVGDRVALIVSVLFHEDHGLLNCDVNTQAINQTLDKLMKLQSAKKKDKNEADDSEDEQKNDGAGLTPHQSRPDSQGTQTRESRPSEKEKKKNKKKKQKLKAFVIESGKTLNAGQQFVEGLSEHVEEVKTVDESNVVLAICPIVSRVGTDVAAAMKVFEDKCSTTKHFILLVLHHTFDRDYVMPDCSRYVGGDRVALIVNGLFHEDEGLLKNCDANTQAINQTLEKLKEIQKEDHRQDGPPKKILKKEHTSSPDGNTADTEKPKMLKDDSRQDELPEKIEEGWKKERTSSAEWNRPDFQTQELNKSSDEHSQNEPRTSKDQHVEERRPLMNNKVSPQVVAPEQRRTSASQVRTSRHQQVKYLFHHVCFL